MGSSQVIRPRYHNMESKKPSRREGFFDFKNGFSVRERDRVHCGTVAFHAFAQVHAMH